MATKTVSTLWSEPFAIDDALFRYTNDSTLPKSVSSTSSASLSGSSVESNGSLPVHTAPSSSFSSSSSSTAAASTSSSSSTASTVVHPSSANPTVSLKYAPYSYDNISFPDVMARTEYGMNLLDNIIDMVKNNIQSEEMYAKALNDSAIIANNGRSKGTGQGIAATVDGAPVKQASMLGAGLQAIGLGGFFGSSSSSSSASSSRGSTSNNNNNNTSNDNTYNPFGGNPSSNPSQSSASSNPNLSITVGNGPTTLINALEQFARAQFKASHQRQMIAAHLRKILNNLLVLKDNQSKVVSQLFGRANEIIRNTQTIARDLERAQQRVDKARKDLQYAEQYLLSAKTSGIEIDKRELQNRQSRVANAMGELETAEGQIILISEALVTGRRRRDDDFTVIARQLQKLDEERNTLLARTLTDLAGTTSETGSASRFLASSLSEAASNIGVESDIRMFTHQRRIAHMIIEQSALADVRNSNRNGNGGGGNNGTGMGLGKGDEEAAVVPQPLPITISMRHHRDFIAAEKQLSPVIVRWINAILDNKGYEILNGQRVPIIGTCGGNESTKDASSVIGKKETDEDDDDEGFDIDMLDHHAARIALLRTLNQQRSKKQDVAQSFYRLARVLWWLLDACAVHEDICCARMVTVMAETFFHDPAVLGATENSKSTEKENSTTEDDDNKTTKSSRTSSSPTSSRHSTTKEFLQSVLKRHPIWRNESFWEEIFFQSVYNAVRVSSSPYNGNGSLQRSSSNGSMDGTGNNGNDMNGGGGGDETPVSPTGEMDSPSTVTSIATVPAARPGTTDWNYGYTQTIFSQLAAVAMNMITFGMPAERVLRTVTSLARGNGLPNEMIHVLLDTVKTYENQEK